MGDRSTTDIFSLLADDTRVGIMQALAERQREDIENPALSFADLRKRVGERDSGNFNYHLEKLTGVFVEKTEAGYSLSYTGIRVVGAIMGGYGVAEPDGETAIDHDCPVCDTQLEVEANDGSVVIACQNDHAISNVVAPRIHSERSIEEVAELLGYHIYMDAFFASKGGCPQCFGRMRWEGGSIADDDMPGKVVFFGQCQDCGLPLSVFPGQFMLFHPGVVAALWEAGIDVWADPIEWAFRTLTAEVESASEDYSRVEVSMAVEDTTVSTVVDISDGVVEIEPDS